MAKLLNLEIATVVVFSDNPILKEKIKNLLNKFGAAVALRNESDFLNNQPPVRGRLILIELEKDYPQKLEAVLKLKAAKPSSIIIGLTGEQFFKKAAGALSQGVDYLLTKPINYRYLPYLLSKI